MKNLKSMFGAMTLGLILSTTAFAGDVSTPGYVPPPPQPSGATLENRAAAPSATSPTALSIEILLAALSAIY